MRRFEFENVRCLKSVAKQFVVGAMALAVVAFAATTAAAAPEMTDQQITDKVEDELLFDPGVTSTNVDASTVNGVVTLDGETTNLLAKQRAARVAETVKGVRSVVNRIQVEPPLARSDDAIEKDVEQALLNNPATDSYEVTTSVQGGEVTLEGTVDSYQERLLVDKVAKGVRGVTGIDDQIEVDAQSDRLDSEIEHEIEQILKWDRFIDDNLISLKVDDGEVRLSGTVGSAAEKRQARVQSWVAGVTSVDDSNLKVAVWARDEKLRGDKFALKPTNEIRDAIEDALLYDPRVNRFNVKIETAGSTVTLRGHVDNLEAKRAAESVARNTVGVTWVTNRLKVEPEEVFTDDEVEAAVRDAFLVDPYVERFEIAPSVIGGTVYLYGTVDTKFEKNRAEEITAGVKGVVDVQNYLRVDDEAAYVYDPYVEEDYFEENVMGRFERRMPVKTDQQLEASIESELWWSPFVNADQLNVSVEDGIATLTGEVDSWVERQSATENAYEGGATLVDNEVTVEYDE